MEKNRLQQIRERWLKCYQGEGDDIPPIMEKCADFYEKEITLLLSEIEGKIEKADISKDKVGTFQDGYRCMKEQLMILLKSYKEKQ